MLRNLTHAAPLFDFMGNEGIPAPNVHSNLNEVLLYADKDEEWQSFGNDGRERMINILPTIHLHF